MKKVLVTGACGYLGARLSKHLAETGYSVIAFDSFNPSKYSQWTSEMEEVIVGDIRDETTLSKLAEQQLDIVIHLISLDHHKSEDNPNFVSSINVMPTWTLLDKFTKHGLDKFIYFSTIQVYGQIPNRNITEKHNPAPSNTYGLTHLLSENICNYFNNITDTSCINVRLSNSYGSPVFEENNCWWLVINDFCKTAFNQNKIKLLSDGSPQRDFIHSSDICQAVNKLMDTEDDFKKNVFHIASGETLTILELAHVVKKVFQDKYQKEISILLPNDTVSNKVDILSQVEKYMFDISKIKSLGFETKTTLDVGISDIFEYLASIAT